MVTYFKTCAYGDGTSYNGHSKRDISQMQFQASLSTMDNVAVRSSTVVVETLIHTSAVSINTAFLCSLLLRAGSRVNVPSRNPASVSLLQDRSTARDWKSWSYVIQM